MTTYLTTDRQTMMDLGIQKSPCNEPLVHSFFLNTETKEGRKMMKNWISFPSSDLKCIKARQEAIAWEGLPPIPLDEEELDFLEHYMAYRDQLSPKNVLISLYDKVDRWFKYDSARYIITRGVKLSIKLLLQLNKLQKEIPDDCPSIIKEFKDQIHLLSLHKEVNDILSSTHEVTSSDFETDRYDYLFRHELHSSIRELLTSIYTLDVCRTARQVALEKGLCISPQLHQSSNWTIKGFRHPLLPKAQTNDWSLQQQNIAILTGSNMAGKSTTLKALTLNIWLAHCGLPVPAFNMSCPIYEGIYTSINLPDSLRDGRSHFMAEVQRIKEILTQANSGKRCLIVLDEMFRSTNAQDAYEASVAVNQLLLDYPHCTFLISTHILEYAKHFEMHPSCKFYYMESNIKDDQFVCSYRLKEGISESKVGFWIIRKELLEIFGKKDNKQTKE